ncbi:MAG: polyphenol oxidase family protein [Thermoanaerobaculia bacterium]
MTEAAADDAGASAEYSVEQSPFGRIIVAPQVPAGYALFYTTRDFEGQLNRDIADSIAAFIEERFGVDCALTTCSQVHGKAVRRISVAATPPPPPYRDCDTCDALWTDDDGVALGIKVADCLPVSLIDPVRGLIANIHSGWRGAVQRITAETLDAIGATSSTTGWLGPSIRVCCFEVGEEVAAQFPRAVIDRTRGPKPHVDLVTFTSEILRRHGIERIFDSGMCTRCDDRFHSFRREPKRGGRNLAIVAR